MSVFCRRETTPPIDNSDVKRKTERFKIDVGCAKPRSMTIDEYIDYKIKILVNHFKLILTREDRNRLKACKTIAAVDRCALSLIDQKL